MRTLARDDRFPPDLVGQLERLPGFRHIVTHEYVALDLNRVVEAAGQLEPIRQFVGIVAGIEGAGGQSGLHA